MQGASAGLVSGKSGAAHRERGGPNLVARERGAEGRLPGAEERASAAGLELSIRVSAGGAGFKHRF